MKETEKNELKQLEKELKLMEKQSGVAYGAPKPRQPVINSQGKLIFAAKNWCIVSNEHGQLFVVSFDSFGAQIKQI